jgi:type II secretory pathway pseudopilin PulG
VTQQVKTSRRRRAPRGFTIVEIGVVAAVVGIVMSVAVLGVSTAAEKSKRATELKAVFSKLEQVRARHLSASGSSEACLRITRTGPSTFELDEQRVCGEAGAISQLDLRATIIAADETCVDSLARPVRCSNLEERVDVAFDIEIDGKPGCDGIIMWRKNGRLTANFFVDQNPGADVQAHLVDVGHSLSPEPTAVGRYAGSATNPRGLLE